MQPHIVFMDNTKVVSLLSTNNFPKKDKNKRLLELSNLLFFDAIS